MPAQSGSLQQAEPALDRQREGDELASLSSVLVVFYTLYFAASLLVPIAAAVLLSMLLAPAAQFLERLHMPRLLASAVVVVAEAADIITAHPVALQLRTLQTMAEIAVEKNSAIIFPVQFMTTVQDALTTLQKGSQTK